MVLYNISGIQERLLRDEKLLILHLFGQYGNKEIDEDESLR